MDPKKSMNVNIFLKQFRKPTEVIIDLLRAGDPRAFGVEKLKGLSKVLPQTDEVGVTGNSLPSLLIYGCGSHDFLSVIVQWIASFMRVGWLLPFLTMLVSFRRRVE